MKSIMLFLIAITLLIASRISYGKNWANWGISVGKNWANWGSSWVGAPAGSGSGYSVYGAGSFQDQEIDKELSVYGAATFNAVKATKDVTIYGAADIKDSTFKNLTVYGTVEAKNSTFETVTLYTTESNFSNSTLDSLEVESKSQKPVIYLTDTTITGNVVFKGKEGKLKLSGTSSINGTTTNGEIK